MVEVPVKIYVVNLVKQARSAARPTGLLSTNSRNAALAAMADKILESQDVILTANTEDVETVGKNLDREAAREAVKRVRYTSETIEDMAETLRRLADVPDPVGAVVKVWRRPSGLEVSRVRVPLGVLAVITELGPLHTVETIGLCLKSGNVSVLRVSQEWTKTHQTLMPLLIQAAQASGVPAGAISFVERPEKEGALELMKVTGLIDAIIVRGGPGLRRTVIDQARMPVLASEGGMSHVYVDAEADLPLAQNIVINSKVQDAGQANSVDTLLVHQSIARGLLPALCRRLLEEFKVSVQGCPVTMSLAGTPDLSHYSSVKAAAPEDYGKQHLSKTIAIKVVRSLDEALQHIAQHGPGHADVIVTRDYASALRFVQEVDSSGALVNVSTRMHDGNEYGLGGHLGTNVGGLHARGPIGLEQLTREKYVVFGSGQLRQPHPVPVTYEDAIMLKRL